MGTQKLYAFTVAHVRYCSHNCGTASQFPINDSCWSANGFHLKRLLHSLHCHFQASNRWLLICGQLSCTHSLRKSATVNTSSIHAS
jgi:hypothetical protein